MIGTMATQRADLDRLIRDLEALSPEERAQVLASVGARARPKAEREVPLGDWMAAGGGWKGESLEQILETLREGRAAGGSAEPPDL